MKKHFFVSTNNYFYLLRFDGLRIAKRTNGGFYFKAGKNNISFMFSSKRNNGAFIQIDVINGALINLLNFNTKTIYF